MDEQRPLCRFPRAQVSGQQVSTLIECPEELHCEELEERAVPGGTLSTVVSVIKKTAGWGC
jgi:hypothetical protein